VWFQLLHFPPINLQCILVQNLLVNKIYDVYTVYTYTNFCKKFLE